MLYSVYEFYRLLKSSGNSPLTIWGLLASAFTFLSLYAISMKEINPKIILGIIPLIIMLPILEIVIRKNHSIENIAHTFLGIIYIAVPFSLLNLIVSPSHNYNSGMLLFLFIVLWANDSGAYITGSLLGKHKLIEQISPNKTWEGAIGGAILAILAGLISSYYFELFSYTHAIILSALITIAGIFGDLTESLIKRTYHIKDSGKFLPGHGGLLDRFDSMLFAAPIFYFYISTFVN